MSEFKNYLDAWNQSKKIKEFQAQLSKKKTESINYALKYNKLMPHKKILISNKELENVLDNILAFEKLDESDKEEFAWTQELAFGQKDKKELFFEYIKALTNWYFYLKKMVLEENYEIADKLKFVIEIEKKEFKDAIQKFCIDFEPADLEWINEIEKDVRKQFNI